MSGGAPWPTSDGQLRGAKQRVKQQIKRCRRLCANDRIGVFAISPDGSRVAFAAKDGEKESLVLDGRELPGPGNLTMSPDGRYVAHQLDTPLSSVLMVNGQRGREYDGFLKGAKWVFHGPDRFVAIAGRKGEILRVEVRISEQ